MKEQNGYNMLEPGETITLQTGALGQTQEFEVLPACEAGAQGHWACSCGEGIMNNMGLTSHRGPKHQIVYVCHEHGPEMAVDG